MKTKRLILARVICGLVTAFSLATVAYAGSFTDVPDTHPNATAIEALKAANIITGFADNTFGPDQPLSRAQAITIIERALGLTIQRTAQKLPFTDVPEDAWYYAYLQKAYALGRVKGYSDNTVKPEDPVILPDAMKLLLEFYGVSSKSLVVDAVIYGGIPNDQWYSKNLQYAKNMNLIEPDANGNFSLSSGLTRAQFAELAYRMRMAKQTGRAFDVTAKWVTTTHEENNWKLRHPAEWGVFKGKFNSVLWRGVAQQPFFTRVWPGGVQLSISIIENSEQRTAHDYFALIQANYRNAYGIAKTQFSTTTIDGKSALKVTVADERLMDQYIAIPGGKFLVMYGQYGSAPIGQWYKKQLELIMNSYSYVATPTVPVEPVLPLETRLQTLREQILVEGGWNTVKNLFKDKKLISTDAIGVGTGAVDYYFSAEAKYTIKVERGTNTILNIREGETNAF
ncbi:S-layer homology domain-containing protein [Candidatus Gracilibacteria bacterium]|nr:S-layer homology domain-containing protein [Candidatus Gracilibacteria bacterium]